MHARSFVLAGALFLGGCCCDPRCPPPCESTTGIASPTAAAPEADLAAATATVRGLLDGDPAAIGARDAALRALGRLLEDGTLRPALRRVAEAVLSGTADEKKRLEHVDEVHDMIAAQLCLRGYLPSCAASRYEPFDAVSARFQARIGTPPPPGESGLSAWALVQGAPFRPADGARPLIDGPASFTERERLIRGAKRTLHVLTWALYDDLTGWEAARWFVERARAGVAVRLVVDGRVAAQRLHEPPVRWLEEQTRAARDAGTPIPLTVIRWSDPARPYDGLHRKVIVADGEAAIVGGMNFGDVYSHRNPKDARRWRDTDLLVTGPAAREAERVFVATWNPQAKRAGVAALAEPPAATAADGLGAAQVAFVVSAPGAEDSVLLSLLLAIEGARTTVLIENAYVIRLAPLEDALRRAIARGVRVRVLSNSPETLDEPVLSYGIVETLLGLAAAGAEVYAKTGATLHSKFVVVDGVFSQVGSYNLHPRSYRLEHEVAANVIGAHTAAVLTKAFDDDVATARRVRGPADLEHPKDPLARLAWLWFSDLL